MDLRNVINWEIPEGVVIKVTDSNGVVIWNKGNNEPDLPDLPTPLANEIYYTSTDGNIVELSTDYSGVQPISNTYENGIGKMVFSLSPEYHPIETLEWNMFSRKINLKTIRLPNSITTIEETVFYNCKNLEKVNIPTNLEHIGNMCFVGCEKLKSLTIPTTISSIGKQPFNLNIQITSNSDRFVIENDCLVDKENNKLIQGLVNKINYSYQIPNDIVTIFNDAFDGCDKIVSVYISEGVKYINERAFAECHALESITFPSTIKSIGYMCFYYTTHIKNITCKAMYAPDINGSFYFPTNSSITEKYLYIPTGAKNYDSDDWKSEVLDKGFELQYITE